MPIRPGGAGAVSSSAGSAPQAAKSSFRRSTILIVCMALTGAIFAVRLFYVQVLQHNHYQAQANREHTAKFTIPAERGLIYAHDGADERVPLVLNEPVYTLYADPRYLETSQKPLDKLRRIAGGNLVEGVGDIMAQTDRQYAVLGRQLTKRQADLIKKEDLDGVGLQESDRRVYPEGQLAAQLLGYVNTDNHGQYGVEAALDGELAGTPGQLKALTDVHGIPLSVDAKNVQQSAKHGKDMLLTIDRNIQAYVEQALKSGLEKAKASHGSMIVLDPQTGKVMAMANYPTYDPAKFYEVQDYTLFQNRVVSDPYEAGSVIKTLTMSAGLNEGVVRPDSTYNNTGSVQVDDATIKNVLQVSGTRTMAQVLEYSLNTGVVHVLSQLGGGKINYQARQKLFDYFSNHYLLGKKTGIEQSGESPGIIISPDEEQGNNVRYANMTFGQGMDVTMIQAASAFAAAINGGTYYKPYMVEGYMDDEGQITEGRQPVVLKPDVLTQTASDQLRHMTHEARSRSTPGADKAGYFVGGKTGTSQIIDPKTGRYIDDNAIGTYLGYGGNQTPRYVIMVRVQDAKIGGYSGSMAAAPIFADVSNWLLDYLRVEPM